MEILKIRILGIFQKLIKFENSETYSVENLQKYFVKNLKFCKNCWKVILSKLIRLSISQVCL